jgi:hypothetical protein
LCIRVADAGDYSKTLLLDGLGELAPMPAAGPFSMVDGVFLCLGLRKVHKILVPQNAYSTHAATSPDSARQ